MSDLGNTNKLNKAQLVELVGKLNAQVEVLKAELAVYQPSQSGRKLSMEKAQMIRQQFGQGMSKNALSLRYQVSRDSIDAVLANQIYKVQIEPAKKAEPVVIETPKPVKKAKTVRNHETVDELNKAKIARHESVKAKLVKKAEPVVVDQPIQAEIVVNEEASQTI